MGFPTDGAKCFGVFRVGSEKLLFKCPPGPITTVLESASENVRLARRKCSKCCSLQPCMQASILDLFAVFRLLTCTQGSTLMEPPPQLSQTGPEVDSRNNR